MYLKLNTAEALPTHHVFPLLQVLAYFDVFSYPLTAAEMTLYSTFSGSAAEADNLMQPLVRAGLVHCQDSYYCLPGPIDKVRRRSEMADRASSLMPTALRYARVISSFPFVKGLCISGSLSKGQMAEDGDVDWFVITEPGRLWLCRLFLTLYKKIVLGNSRAFCCINYYISAEELRIPDRNMYTATELSFLWPVYGHQVFTELLENNRWIRAYYPNGQAHTHTPEIQARWPRQKAIIEKVLRREWAKGMEKAAFGLFSLFVQWRYKRMPQAEREHRFKMSEGVSTYHPQSFQHRVLRAYQERLDKLVAAHQSAVAATA